MATKYGRIPPELLAAYQNNTLDPEMRAEFETSRARGEWDPPEEPTSAQGSVAFVPGEQAPKPKFGAVPAELFKAYQNNTLDPKMRAEFEASMARGEWIEMPGVKTPPSLASVPSSSKEAPDVPAPLPPPEAPPPEDQIESWIWQPEFWNRIWGTSTADTKEATKIIKDADPSIQTDERDDGTVIFTRKNGTQFKIAPGMRIDNLITTAIGGLGQLAASSLTSKFLGSSMLAATPIFGSLLKRIAPAVAKTPEVLKPILLGAFEQGVAETGQKLAGGSFDLAPIGTAAGIGTLVQGGLGAAGKTAGAVRKGIDYVYPPGGPAVPNLAEAGAAEIGATTLDAAKRTEAANALQRVYQPDVEAALTARTIGLDPVKEVPIGFTSGNADVQRVVNTLAAEGSALETDQARRLAAVDARREAIIRGAATTEESLSKLSDTAERQIGLDMERLKVAEKSENEFLKRRIDQREPLDTSEVIKFIDDHERDLIQRGSPEDAAKLNESKMMKRIKKLLAPREIIEISKRTGMPIIDKATNEPKTKTWLPTFARGRLAASWLKQAIRGEGPFSEDLNRWIAPELLKRLEPALINVADKYLVKDAYLASMETVKKKYAALDNLKALFRKGLDRSLVSLAREGVKKGVLGQDPKTLRMFLDKIPMGQRDDIISSAFLDAFSGKTTEEFNALMRGLNKNRESKALLFSHLKPGAWRNLDAVHRVTELIERAQKAKGLSTGSMVPEAPAWRGFLDSLAGPLRLGTLALPWRQAGMSRMFIGMLRNPRDPKWEPVRKWLQDPATVEFLMGLSPEKPFSPGAFQRMVNSPTSKRIAAIARRAGNEIDWNRIVRSSMHPGVNQGSEE